MAGRERNQFLFVLVSRGGFFRLILLEIEFFFRQSGKGKRG